MPEGCWVVFMWDHYPVVRSIHLDELEARRVVDFGEYVKFIRWGEDFQKAMSGKTEAG